MSKDFLKLIAEAIEEAEQAGDFDEAERLQEILWKAKTE